MTSPSPSLGGGAAADAPSLVGPSTVPLARRYTFERLCKQLERVSLSTLRAKVRRETMEAIVKFWIEHDLPPPNRDIFALYRLLMPQYDHLRAAYGVKEKAIAKLYIQALGVAQESDAARKLINWKNSHFVQNAGDFTAVVEEVLARRINVTTEKMTVFDVNALLDALIVSSSDGKKKHLEIFRTMITRLTPLENKWLVKMILRNLKVGISEDTIMRYLHPDAHDVYNACSDLAKVCRDLTDPSIPSKDKQVMLFRPFRPMLAGRDSVNRTVDLMGNQEFYVELKLDGERSQLHKDGDRYQYWSRKKKDYTKMYGASPNGPGALTRFIHTKCFPGVRNCILDGEMMTIDEDGNYGPFGTLKTTALANQAGDGQFRKRRRDDDNDDDNDDDEDDDLPTLDEHKQVCFVVFDILFLNDNCLTGLPLKERKSLLSKYIVPYGHHLHVMKHVTLRTMDELFDQMNAVLQTQQEGLVAKRVDSPYVVNLRDAKFWLKIKPEYLDGLGDTLDVLIVGGFWSDGRRRGGNITHFMCAIPDEKTFRAAREPPQSEPEAISGSVPVSFGDVELKGVEFVTFHKFGSGVSDGDLAQLTQRLGKHWKPWENGKPPKWFKHSATGESPDVYVEPQHSIVAEIKATQIVPSKEFGCGYTLRFPRFLRIRSDKGWQDCLKLEEMHRIRSSNPNLVSNRPYADAADDKMAKKRKVERPPRRGRAELAPHLKGANLSKVVAQGTLFKDKLFYVANVQENPSAENPKLYTKEGLEVLIAEQSGSLTQSVKDTLFCVIADEPRKAKVASIIQQGDHDVVKSQWVYACLKQKAIISLEPSIVLHAKPVTKQRFARRADEVGDSFTAQVTADELLQIMSKIPEPSASPLIKGHDAEQMFKKRYRILHDDLDWGLFEEISVLGLGHSDDGNFATTTTEAMRCRLALAHQYTTLATLVTHGATVHPDILELPRDVDDAYAVLRAFLDEVSLDVSHVLVPGGGPAERDWASRMLSGVLPPERLAKITIIDASWVLAAIDAQQF